MQISLQRVAIKSAQGERERAAAAQTRTRIRYDSGRQKAHLHKEAG